MTPIEFPTEKQEEHHLRELRTKQQEESAKRIAEQTGLPYMNLAFQPVQRNALILVPKDEAKKAKLAIINRTKKMVTVALRDPENPFAKEIIETLKQELGVSLVVVSDRSLEKAWQGYPPEEGKEKIAGEVSVSSEVIKQYQEKISSLKGLGETLDEMSEQKNASRILEVLLAGCLKLRVSDIHVEPAAENTRLRLRVDGLMREITRFEQSIFRIILNRIKLLSKMKLNVHNIAQDGRIAVDLGEFEIQIRTSILPGEFGENIVMRVLNPNSLIELEQLGIREDLYAAVEEQIKKPNGMILTTGPTGSGKTTTLYSFLKKLRSPETKIITIEDPIEYRLEGISQSQTDPERGYTFGSALRAILRQDPDVILVGEIRDLETADIAIQAALTGHLVLSTLHTNDAAGVIPRLTDIGANAASIGPALNMAIAQRLIRRVCKECKIFRKATPEELELIKNGLANLPPNVKIPKEIGPNLEIAEPKGCDVCSQEGYKGRVGIYEILLVTPRFQQFLTNNPSITEIRDFSRKEGLTTLYHDGLLKVLDGVTTIEEVERIAGKAEAPEVQQVQVEETSEAPEETIHDSLLLDLEFEGLNKNQIADKPPRNGSAGSLQENNTP